MNPKSKLIPATQHRLKGDMEELRPFLDELAGILAAKWLAENLKKGSTA